ncbi:peptide chain release factor N(5)-glutamine methyltransferase [Microlunatus elymi]|uniref:Release factor glutamine methyltransferase n=1 Tax=Microlunatus elymi TaxID=2596828 RepID=A0A516Q0V2_9ACTN|nr:peptide chain release factor N(5)-glutamine methyltransferase [Microlunatus elymi]QDP97059.1 peptide chain release factor N(5)-glutamine methyltransferase [Microlunatus elymi]
MADGRSVRELLATARSRLAAAGVDSPDVDARLLLAAAAEVDPSRLLIMNVVDSAGVHRFETMLRRRESREPLQHITGIAYFRHVRLQVGPGVFVPRPETELMTGWAIDRLAEVERSGRVPVAVDLCTGSGAIARALADEAPAAELHAVELSEAAASWAARNLAGTGVELRVGDMADAYRDLDGTVDVVVCNPPYIPLTAWESVQTEARDHDPELALFSGDDGLDAVRALTGVAARLLRAGGWVACEHAELQAESVPELFARHGGFTEVRDHRDLSDRPRFTTARRTA